MNVENRAPSSTLIEGSVALNKSHLVKETSSLRDEQLNIGQSKLTKFAHPDARYVATSDAEFQALKLLSSLKPEMPEEVILISDPNKDPDDLVTLSMVAQLEKMGLLKLNTVLTTLGEEAVRVERAKMTKQLLLDTGVYTAAVGIGSDYSYSNDKQKGDHQKFLPTTLLADSSSVELDGQTLLRSTLRQAANKSQTIVVIAGMSDLAKLLSDANGEKLFSDKVKKVVIMGGLASTEVGADAQADQRAYNNTVDQASADLFYKKCQELGVALTVVTKEAAYAATITKEFYSGLDATNHPFGVYLQAMQNKALQGLFESVVAGRIPGLSVDWFFNTFTSLDPKTASDAISALVDGFKNDHKFENIWAQVTKLNPYDPLTLLAALPTISEALFNPKELSDGLEVIGKDEVNNISLARDCLSALAKVSLRGDLEVLFNRVVPHSKCRTEQPTGYPQRKLVTDDTLDWSNPAPGYDPEYYVAPVVLKFDVTKTQGGWADPEDFSLIPEKRVGFEPTICDQEGRNLNPRGRTGLSGRGLLGKWGVNFAADPIVTRVDSESGLLQMIAIKRGDSGQWAIPGGMVEKGQTISNTLAAELSEEAGVELNFDDPTILYQGYVDDPRNTDHAWMETSVALFHLDEKQGSEIMLQAGSDAVGVKWETLTPEFLQSLYASHGSFVKSAIAHIFETQRDELPATAREQLLNILSNN